MAAAALLLGGRAAPGAPPKEPPAARAGRKVQEMSGHELYLAHCASCHGLEGRRDGPAAEAMRMRPKDLAQLTVKFGRFPAARVERFLGGIEGFPAHGGRRMPAWGPVFMPLSPVDGQAAALANRLVRYLESIQEPARQR